MFLVHDCIRFNIYNFLSPYLEVKPIVILIHYIRPYFLDNADTSLFSFNILSRVSSYIILLFSTIKYNTPLYMVLL